MIQYIHNEDIAYADVNIIINASNGIGWMGGTEGIERKLKGVAESIHFASKGEVEKINNVWADTMLLDLKQYKYRFYSGNYLFI